jgi:hypothetical protein
MVDSVKNNISHYDMAQQYLKSQINQPKDLADLKRNANIKLRQVQLARAQGDLEVAAVLAYEHQQIVNDINNYYRK